MEKHRIFTASFASVYPLYLAKVERKGRTQAELDAVLLWLTGYAQQDLDRQIETKVDLETFFADAPELNPNRLLITGTVCGIRVEAVEDPLMREIRYLDKLVDELAKGRPLAKILRQAAL